MLQRAASNAYSWWWASHIRTKQSKWLEQNLQDMEEKVDSMLKIIENEGDSFIQRAQMYYQKRPELVNTVQESYRAYRSLAEKYDSLSKDLQSANRTMASAFPEQVPFAVGEEDDEQHTNQLLAASPITSKPSIRRPNVPKPPLLRKDLMSQSMLQSRKGQLKTSASSPKAASSPRSGLAKDEALEEIDNLLKEILNLQTEREFVRCSYEKGYKRFCDIENQISERQQRVCNLQHEFDVCSFIDDDEARTLMATRAIKSCQDTVLDLKEKHDHSTESARAECKKVKQIIQKFEAFKDKFNSPEADKTNPSRISKIDDVIYQIDTKDKERQDLEVLRKKMEKQTELSSNHPLTTAQYAEKIDELVQRILSLENAVFSEKILVKRLRSDTNELQARVKSLEEDKEAHTADSDIMNKKMKEMEEELIRVKHVLKTVVEQNNILKTQFSDTSCTINHLSLKLQGVKLLEVDNTEGVSEEEEEVEAKTDAIADMKAKVESESIRNLDTDSEGASELMEEDKSEKYETETESNFPDTDIEEHEVGGAEEEQPNWRQLYLSGLDDREKNLLEEYSSVLKDYKEVRQKLNEVEQKNRDGFFELTLQIRELKTALATKDEEIQALRQNGRCKDENNDGNSVELEAEAEAEAPRLSASQESSLTESIQESPAESHEKVVLEAPANHPVLTVTKKVRSDIDGLLEENLEFWLRFSTSFHQIQKYQTSVQDLKLELSKLRQKQKQDGFRHQAVISDIRPIYSHIREVKTELKLWLENNSVMKDEVKGRFASLCNVQEEIVRVTSKSKRGNAGDTELSECQAAKFQGEILNMKQENKKVADELKLGFDCVRGLKLEVDKVMESLEREFGVATVANNQNPAVKPRIPLRFFLFGMKKKPKKQPRAASLFACGQPSLRKQNSFLIEPNT